MRDNFATASATLADSGQRCSRHRCMRPVSRVDDIGGNVWQAAMYTYRGARMDRWGTVCRICLLGLPVLLAGAAVAAPTAGANADQPAQLRVVTDNNYPPFLFVDASGKADGYTVDMWRLFERYSGIKVNLEATDWASAQDALLSGRADVIDMLFRTPRREALYDYSPPYARLKVGIYVDRRIYGVHDVASLRGFPVGVEAGDACAERLESLGFTELHQYRHYRDIIRAATRGEILIFCMDEYPASYFLYREHALNRFSRAFVLYTGEFHRAVRKGDAALLEAVEKGMAMIPPAEREAVRKKWLDRPFILTPWLHMAGTALAIGAALVVLMLVWVWLLRRTVARRTRALRDEEGKLRAMFDASPDAMWLKDPAGVHRACNDRVAEYLGIAREDLLGRTDDELFPPALASTARAMEAEVLRLGQPRSWQLPFEANGVTRQLEITKVPLSGTDDAVGGVLSVARDISEQKRTEAELRLAAVAFESQAALLVFAPDGTIERVNRFFARLSGYTAEELIGKPASILGSRHLDGGLRKRMLEQLRQRGFWQGELWIEVKTGEPRVVRATISAVLDDGGRAAHYVCAMIDLTSEREAHANVDRMTFFDSLTDLPNRHFLLERLQHSIDGKVAQVAALLLFDIDHFKRVNDLRGHAAGDRLLALLAARLSDRPDAYGILGRLGGGTFGVLLASGNAAAGATQARVQACAEGIRTLLRAPFQVDAGMPVEVTVSMGWTHVGDGHALAESVLKEAELAMYAAKSRGRDQVCRFESFMQDELARQETLLYELRTALVDDGFLLRFQAQFDRAGGIIGAEALLCLPRSDGEIVPPGQFIPVAEANGLITAIGTWVLRRACRQLVSWSQLASTRALSLSVNVSALQFDQASFVDEVRSALLETGADPGKLKLEITESAILGDLTAVAAKLNQLRAHGIHISLDDFGTGYSSLTYLSRLPLDEIKIDRSFVARLADNAEDATLVQTIIGMSHGLGLAVIAEGVETAEQRDFLMRHACDAFQGYLFAHPLPAEAFARMHAAHAGSPAHSQFDSST